MHDPNFQISNASKEMLSRGLFIKDLVQELQFSPILRCIDVYINLDQVVAFLNRMNIQILTKNNDPEEYYKAFDAYLKDNVDMFYLNMHAIDEYVKKEIFLSDRNRKDIYTRKFFLEYDKLKERMIKSST